MLWRLTTKGNPHAVALMDRHYSRRPSSRGGLVAGPGRCLTMLTIDNRALWVSHHKRADLVKHAWPGAWECTVFRNESAMLSSELIRDAVALTRWKWGDPPAQGLVTFVDEDLVRSTNPGCCFKNAGFVREPIRTKKRGLLVLRLDPRDFPPPEGPWTPTLQSTTPA